MPPPGPSAPDEKGPLRSKDPKPVLSPGTVPRGFLNPRADLPGDEGTLPSISATAGDLKAPNPSVAAADLGITFFKNWFIPIDGVNSLAGTGAVLGTVPPAGEDGMARPQAAAATSRAEAGMPTTRITMIANIPIRPIASLLSLGFKRNLFVFRSIPFWKQYAIDDIAYNLLSGTAA